MGSQEPKIYLYETGKLLQKKFPEAKAFNSVSPLAKAIQDGEQTDVILIMLDEQSESVLEQFIQSSHAGKIVVVSDDIPAVAHIAKKYPPLVCGPSSEEFLNFLKISLTVYSQLTAKGFAALIGENEEFRQVVTQATKVAKSDATVLLSGESGTGKELFARGIHTASPRSQKPFIAVNCAAIPKELMELEFFGSTKGAFTDALKSREGYFAAAQGGTLFLDEIAELPLSLQAKLLRVLQEKRITPVGSSESVPVNARIISATHRDLELAVEEGTFRQDLLYRLQVVTLVIPPLRDRTDDIRILAPSILGRLAKKYNRKDLKIADDVLEAFEHYAWPGNVRQLENLLEQAFVMTESSTITGDVLPTYFEVATKKTASEKFVLPEGFSLKAAQAALEDYLIGKAMAHTKGNKTQASKLLSVSHRWLLYTLKNK